MTTQYEDETVFQPPMEHDPFPQPQTIPAGWDVSVFNDRLEAAGSAEELSDTQSN